MEGVSYTTEGVEQGDPEEVPNEAELASRFAKNCTTIEADTTGRDEVSASASSVRTPSCSELRSARIESMIASRSEFDSELEFQTAHSKVHWSELSHEGASDSEESAVDHRQYFEKLQKDAHWGSFCGDVADVVLGRKLAEGAQADIYEAQITFVHTYDWIRERREYVVKVMKGDCALEDLQNQWPRGIVGVNLFRYWPLEGRLHGALVKDHATQKNRFGFVMHRFWGDLRRLIDLRMQRNNAKGPPFSVLQAKRLMHCIAVLTDSLHGSGIMHKDLKASNVLVSHLKKECDLVSSNDPYAFSPYVADWECSVGVVGTGFWRAPEILQQLKNKIPPSKLEFNEKVDVYSYAMTCFEIATGLTPFEGLPYIETRDAVLNGTRPKLPHDLDPTIRDIITSCWDPNPSFRPNFPTISKKLDSLFDCGD